MHVFYKETYKKKQKTRPCINFKKFDLSIIYYEKKNTNHQQQFNIYFEPKILNSTGEGTSFFLSHEVPLWLPCPRPLSL